MNERVKELRQALGLSGEKFGQSIGLNRAAVSKIETGTVGVSESNIKLICLIYNVNEDWLRNGAGNMFNETKAGFLADIQKQFSLSDLQVNIIRAYLELNEKDRESIDKFITSCHKNTNDSEI